MSDYGIDLAIGGDGDLQVTPSGDLASISGPANCAQALAAQLRTHPGELEQHRSYGSTLTEQIGQHLDGALATAAATGELRRVLASDTRYLGATDIAMTTDPSDPSHRTLSLRLQLTGGETLNVPDAINPEVDQISADPAPALDPAALAEIGAFSDPSDDLPELADLNGDDAGTSPDDDLSLLDT